MHISIKSGKSYSQRLHTFLCDSYLKTEVGRFVEAFQVSGRVACRSSRKFGLTTNLGGPAASNPASSTPPTPEGPGLPFLAGSARQLLHQRPASVLGGGHLGRPPFRRPKDLQGGSTATLTPRRLTGGASGSV